MAYLSEGYIPSEYAGANYHSYAPGVAPTPDSAYVSDRYLSGNYTSPNYTDTTFDAGGAFNDVGTRANVGITGYAGGLSFLGQGSGASVGVTLGWSGFLPDPGGILDNDSDPDGDPLSYTVLTQPDAGTLTTYAGGAFDWSVMPGTPEGRYTWTYQLYAGGESTGPVTVTMILGQEFASAGVQGFAGQFGTGFNQQGTPANSLLTGFGGELLLTFDQQGTGAALGVTGYSATLESGLLLRGTQANVDSQGFSGALQGTFNQQGTAALVGSQGFSGTLNTGSFLNDQGTAADLSVTGYAGSLLVASFNEQGTAAEVIPIGNAGNTVTGLDAAGTAATVSVLGFSPASTELLAGQFVITVDAETDTITVNAEAVTITVDVDDEELAA